MIEVVALARALADAREHRVAAMRLGDVVDQLHDDHGLADAGAAEQANLAALGVRREQIDDLDAGDQDLGLGRLVNIRRCRRMDRAPLGGLDRPRVVNRLAHHVHDAAQGRVAHGHGDRLAGIDDLLSAHQAFGRVHGDGAYGVLAEMLGDLEHEAVAVIVGLERVQDLRKILAELHVDHGAHDLAHLTLGALIGGHLLLLLPGLGHDGGFLCHACGSFE